MSKSNLPLTLTGEAIEYQRLYNLTQTAGRSMTTTGAYTFTSVSSGTAYSTVSGGEYNVFLQLQTALANYLINETDYNGLATQASVTAVADDLASHVAENAILTPQEGSTANAVVLILTAEQYKKWSFRATADNTGNIIINTKPFLKLDGSQIPAGGIKNGKVYDFYYDTASGGRFFLLARAEGDAVVANVLAGKKFSNDNDSGLTGTMTNNGVATITPSTNDQSLQGYYASGSKVSGSSNLTSDNLKAGVQIFNIIGNVIPATYDYTGTDETFATSTTRSTTNSDRFVLLKEMQIKFSGIVRIKIRLTNTGQGQIYVNNTPRGTLRNNSGAANYTEDITVNYDDLIQVYGKAAPAISFQITTFNIVGNFDIPLSNIAVRTLN